MSRAGTFSSSKIGNLMSKGRGNFSVENIGKPFITYVQEKAYEKKLGRALSKDNSARATAWGHLCEEQAFNKMDLIYSLVSKERFYHEDYSDFWSGMPDLLTEDIVGDIKCPYTLKSFCYLIESMKDVKVFKQTHSDYYWQLVSNAILTGRNEAMLIVYVPYLKDLEEIKDLARSRGEELDNRFSFINWAEDEELPYLIEGNHYTDLNVMEFTIPEEDKELLTERVAMAVEILKGYLNE
jgi:hypothetical protein